MASAPVPLATERPASLPLVVAGCEPVELAVPEVPDAAVPLLLVVLLPPSQVAKGQLLAATVLVEYADGVAYWR